MPPLACPTCREPLGATLLAGEVDADRILAQCPRCGERLQLGADLRWKDARRDASDHDSQG